MEHTSWQDDTELLPAGERGAGEEKAREKGQDALLEAMTTGGAGRPRSSSGTHAAMPARGLWVLAPGRPKTALSLSSNQ